MAAEDSDSTFVEFARREFDDALRTVVRHRVEDAPVHDLVYVRDDVESRLEPELEDHVSALAREFILESIERDWHESVHRSGSFRGTVRLFDQAAEIRLYDRSDSGFSVSVDVEALGNVDSFFTQAETYFPPE